MVTEARFKIMPNQKISLEENEYIVYDSEKKTFSKHIRKIEHHQGLVEYLDADVITPLESLEKRFFNYTEISRSKMVGEFPVFSF